MSKIGVKKLIVFMLIVVSAIACFGVIGLAINKDVNISEQYVDIGLDYQDGWYLINDADDYYVMCDHTSVGAVSGAKFKLMNDITVDPRRANTNTFSDATLEGNGYTVNMELDPEYEPETNSTAFTDGWGKYMTSSGIYYNKTNMFIGSSSGDVEVLGVSLATYLGDVESGTGTTGSASSVGSSSVNAKKYTISSSETINLSTDYNGYYKEGSIGLAVGGVFGVVKNATIKNIYVTISGSISMSSGQGSAQWIMLGGLAGMSYNSTITLCAVDFVGSGYLSVTSYSPGGRANCGALVGYAQGGNVNTNVFMYEQYASTDISNLNMIGLSSGTSTSNNYKANALQASTNIMDKTGFDVAWNSNGVLPSDYQSHDWVTYVNDINDKKPIQTCFVNNSGGSTTEYTVTANANGGTFKSLNNWTSSGTTATKKFSAGASYGAFPTLAREGYTLQGWYTSSTGGSIVSTSSKVNSTHTIYARWTLNKYTIIADPNGGTLDGEFANGWTLYEPNDDYGGCAYLVIQHNGSYGSFPNVDRGIGYELLGWATSPSSTSANINEDTKVTGAHTIYAVWRALEYTISYETLSNTSIPQLTYTYQDKITLPTPTRSGSTGFIEWKVTATSIPGSWSYGQTFKAGEQLTKKRGNVTLTAVWEPDIITLSLPSDADISASLYNYSKANSNNQIEYLYTDTFNLPNANQVRWSKEVELKGWKVLEAKGNWSATTLSPGASISKKYGNITLVPEYELIVYTISFSTGDGEINDSYSISSDYAYYNKYSEFIGYYKLPEDEKFYVPDQYQMTREHYEFAGWILGNYAQTINFITSGSYVIGVDEGSYGNARLVAEWVPKPYTLTLDPVGTGGEGTPTITSYNPSPASYADNKITYNITQKFNLPSDIHMISTVGGYELLGWKVSTVAGNWKSTDTFTEGQLVSGRYGDAKLEAIWGLKTYYIKLDLDDEDKGEYGNGTVSKYIPSGTGTSYNSTDGIGYTIKSAFDLPSVDEQNSDNDQITKLGYKFLGWTIKSGGTTIKFKPEAATYVTSVAEGSYGSAELQAVWEVIEYELTFDLNGGSMVLGDNDLPNYKPSSDAGKARWKENSTNKIIYTIEDEYNLPIKTDVYMHGKFLNGWTMADKTYMEIDPTSGYVITIKKGSHAFVTVKAEWGLQPYAIQLLLDKAGEYGNGLIQKYELLNEITGLYYDEDTNVITYTVDSGFDLPAIDLENSDNDQVIKTGYKFLGWEIVGTTTINFNPNNKSYVTGVSVGNIGDATLQAVWEIIPYYITIEFDGGSIKVDEEGKPLYQVDSIAGKASYDNVTEKITYTIEDQFNLPNKYFVFNLGHDFNGWLLDEANSDSTVKFGKDGEYKVSVTLGSYGNAKIIADWEILSYYIYLDLDDEDKKEYGNGKIEDEYKDILIEAEFTNGETPYITYNVKSNLFKLPNINYTFKTGYEFQGWVIKTGGENIKFSPEEGYHTEVNTGSTGIATLQAVWQAIEYELTFNLNGGSMVLGDNDLPQYSPSSDAGRVKWKEGSTNKLVYTIEDEYNLPVKTDVYMHGKFLNGWTMADKTYMEIDPTSGYVITIKKGSHAFVTVKAEWGLQPYYIYLDLDDEVKNEYGKGLIQNYELLNEVTGLNYNEDTRTITYTVDDGFDLPAVDKSNSDNDQVTKTGYKFLGWEIVGTTTINFNPNNKSYVTGVSVGNIGDATLQAVWEIIPYYITIEFDGGSIKVDEEGKPLYQVDSIAGKASYDNVTEKITYTIEDQFNLPDMLQMFKLGYNFEGWLLDDSSATTVGFGKNGDYVASVKLGSYGDAELIADWKIITYEIDLILDGKDEFGNGVILDEKYILSSATGELRCENNVIYYTVNDAFYLPAIDKLNPDNDQITKLGYKFLGWTIKDGGETINFEPDGATYITNVAKLSTGTATLQANWEAVEYNITIDLNGGSMVIGEDGLPEYKPSSPANKVSYDNATKIITYTIEDEFILPIDAELFKRGKYLNGWTISTTEGMELEFADKYVVKVVQGSHADRTIQADWGSILYYITLDLDDESKNEYGSGVITGYDLSNPATGLDYDEAARKITYTVDDGFELPTSTYTTKTGYKFLGWTINLNETINFNPNNDSYVTGVAVGNIGNAELQATWEIIEYEITLVLDKAGQVGEGEIKDYTPISAAGRVSYEDKVITYTIEDMFDLPEKLQVFKLGYDFEGWLLNTGSDNTVQFGVNGEYKVSVALGSYGNASLQADWAIATYTLTLDLNGGQWNGYSPNVDEFKNNQIRYTMEDVFNLPTRYEIVLDGFTAMQWKLTQPSPAQSPEKRHNWGSLGSLFTQGLEIGAKMGDVTLQAVWTENGYNIKLHANNGTENTTLIKVQNESIVQITNYDATTGIRKVISTGENTEEFTIDWDLAYSRHIFVGWATAGYNGVLTYEYIDTNFTSSNIVEAFDYQIMEDGRTVTKLAEGDYEYSTTIDIYAIWIPIYTITLELNLPTDLSKSAKDVSGIYDSGVLTSRTNIVEDNDYYHDYRLYSQEDTDIFYAPSVVGLRMHCYGHYIQGWVIKVGAIQYYVEDGNLDPSYEKWLATTNLAQLVESNVNMRYLQGNIVAIPQWKPLTFDVRFVTQSSEGYKAGYEDTKISKVTYNNKYIMSIDTNISVSATTKVVLVTDILGYSVIYAHPYNDTSLMEDTTITLDGTWSYRLSYKQYAGSAYIPSDSSIKWYVVVEGYYAPDIYRLKLDLQLPYSINNDFKLNNNDYTLTNVNLSDLQSIYSAKVLTNTNDGVTYVDSLNYTSRQGVLYKVGEVYYIYLQQDQVIDSEYVYDLYDNGKAIQDTEGLQLPNFEIAYYQMQYYYTFNNENSVNMYQIGELDDDHKANSVNKLANIGAESISYNNDWKYTYCDTNEELNTNFALHVYWYRNIVNLDINNLLDGKDSFNGYALIEEVEQITASLQDHNVYHLIIYTLTDEVYTYTTYAFDNLNLLKSTKYDYSKIVDMFNTKTVEELNALGISKQTTNIVTIYFGNTFKVHAVDQSKDHSLDEFIGYRFDKYTYTTLNKLEQLSTCVNINEFDNYVNNGSNYTVVVNLQDYEHEKNGNTTNYVLDKDVINVDLHFELIDYTFRYQVTDYGYNVVSKYGNIQLEYQSYIHEGYQFEYTVNVNTDNTLKSTMKVRLGTELISWDFVNLYAFMDLTADDSQTCRLIVTPTFLRNYVYVANNPNAYSSAAIQKVGDVNAVCQDILFEIRVLVQDLSTEEVIREYILNDSETNTIFTIQGENTVSIENSYVLKMMSKKASDAYVYYYQDKQYVLRKMYILPSLKHSTSQLTQEFEYPQTEFSDVSMSVTHNLLEGSVNYIQFIEVSPENRYLTFYVDVAPTYEVEFIAKINENDQFKGARQVLVENVVVANADDGQTLTIVVNKYLGYWGQQTLFNFNALPDYYEKANLSIDYEEDVDTEFAISVNNNVRYAVNNNAIVTIELIPQTYNINVYVKYNEIKYSTNDEYGINGEIPLPNLQNASGTPIFDLEKGVVVKPDKGNVDTTKAVYYCGDKINITYLLNSAVANDFIVAVYGNDVKIYLTNGKYVVQFNDSDIEVRIEVRAATDAVTLTTNLPNHVVGEIYAQVNNGDLITIQNASYTEEYTEVELINGDKLTVYIKATVGYEFDNSYEYNLTLTPVTVSQGTGSYSDFVKFTLFDTGFNLSQKGWYYLEFDQIPIEVEFKYYAVVPEIEEVEVGTGYMATSEDSIIQKGSEVILNKGNDNAGFRFESYSYVAAQGEEGSVALQLTQLSGTQQSFVIDDDILSYLSTVEKIDGKIILPIYVNYVRQYKYEYEYKCNSANIKEDVVDINEKELKEGEYYDYGTELEIRINTVDNVHYKLKVTLENEDGQEEINSATMSVASIIEGSQIYTNLGNLAGFRAKRALTSNYRIIIDMEVEQYDTILSQTLNKTTTGGDEVEEIGLQSKGSNIFNLYENIYYQVQATHEYGTEVKVKIYVILPNEQSEQYYTISSATINGQDLSINQEGEEIVDGKISNVYTLSYILRGTDMPTTMDLNVQFKALYYVTIN